MNKIREYIDDREFRITIIKDKVSIINYSSIEHIDGVKVVIKSDNNLISINGNNLTIIKLVDDEVLISGIISNIKFDDNEK